MTLEVRLAVLYPVLSTGVLFSVFSACLARGVSVTCNASHGEAGRVRGLRGFFSVDHCGLNGFARGATSRAVLLASFY